MNRSKALMNICVNFEANHRQSAMKQYLKNKPIKWGFKFWIRAASLSGYVYELDLYLGKKTFTPELLLGEGVVLKLTKRLRNTHVFCIF